MDHADWASGGRRDSSREGRDLVEVLMELGGDESGEREELTVTRGQVLAEQVLVRGLRLRRRLTAATG
jgi:hypothetical protein